MLIIRETAHGRRVESQSRRSTDVSVHHHGDHFTLHSAQWRAPPQLEVVVDRSHVSRQADVRQEDLEDPRQVTILTLCVPDERAPNAAGFAF